MQTNSLKGETEVKGKIIKDVMIHKRQSYRWVVLSICWFGYIIAMMQRLSIGPLAPFLKEGLSLTSSQIGMFTSAIFLGYMISLVPAGILVDKANERWVLSFSEITGGAFVVCMFFVSHLYQALIFMCLCGIGLGAILPATSKAILTWFPEHERGTAMGIKHTAINIGGIIGSVTLPSISLALSWRHSYMIIGVAGMIVGIATLLYYRPFQIEVQADLNKRARESILEVLRDRNILLVTLAGFCATIEFALITYFVLFLKEALGFAIVTAGFLLAVLEGGGGLGKPILGFISDIAFHGSRKRAYLLVCIVWTIASLIVAFISPILPTYLLVVLFIIIGMSTIGWSGIHFTFIAELGGKNRVGTATGISTIILTFGGMLWPPVVGKIIDMTGGYRWMWIFVSVLGVAASVLLLFVRESGDDLEHSNKST